MAKLTVYGASDDLIEVEGDLREEFNGGGDEPEYLAFSDGTVLSIQYTHHGFWRINRLVAGTAAYTKTEGDDEDKNYSDRVTLEGDLTWVVFGSQLVKVKAPA